MLVVTVVVILGYFVFPTSTLLDQFGTAAAAEDSLSALEEKNDELKRRIELLQTDEEIERIARRDFNLVYPGEEAYAVLPPAPRAVGLPNAWPFNVIRDGLAE